MRGCSAGSRVAGVCTGNQPSVLEIDLLRQTPHTADEPSAHRNTTLRYKADVEGASLAGAGSQGSGTGRLPLPSANLSLRRKLKGGALDLKAELGCNTRLLASSGYDVVPVHASVDVSTSASVPSAVQFRLGIHQVRVGDLAGGRGIMWVDQSHCVDRV